MKNMNPKYATWMTAALLAMVAGLATGCAEGFKANDAASQCVVNATGACVATNIGSGGGGFGGGGTSGNTWSDINVDGTINGGRFDKTQVVSIDKNTKQLVIRMPFIAGIALGAQAAAPIPDIPGASLGIESNADGSSSLVLRLPLEKVLNGMMTLPKGRLPNGDPLPAIPDGELPSVGLAVERSGNLRGALYLGPTVVGLFVTTKFDPFIRLTLPIRNQSRTVTWGYFTTIPAKTGFDGGFFLSIALPADLARAIDDLL